MKTTWLFFCFCVCFFAGYSAGYLISDINNKVETLTTIPVELAKNFGEINKEIKMFAGTIDKTGIKINKQIKEN